MSVIQLLTPKPPGECEFKDKRIVEIIDLVDEGVAKLKEKYPNFDGPNVKFGLRGTKYYVEFPVTAHNVDCY